MSNYSVNTQTVNGVTKIPFWSVEEVIVIKVGVPRRKLRLAEIYPQRAILEEARSLRKNANDFIDHDYYEKELEKTPERYARMLEKYGVGIKTK